MKISTIRTNLREIKENSIGTSYKDDVTREQSITIVNAIMAVYKDDLEQLDWELNAWYNNLKSFESYDKVIEQFKI